MAKNIAPERYCELTYFRGRVALAEILRGLGVGPGDLVAIQSFTCVAVPEAVMAVGATPVWIDVGLQDVNMSAQSLQDNWSDKIKAVVIQHTFGMMADMKALSAVVGDRAPIIEDCCHTYYSSQHGQQAGSFGIAGFYSFEWGKPTVIGAGGSAVVHDEILKQKLEQSHQKMTPPSKQKLFKLALQGVVFRVLYRPEFYWALKSLFHRLSRSGMAVGNYNPITLETGPAIDFSTRMSSGMARKLKKALRGIDEDRQRRNNLGRAYLEAFTTINGVTLLNRAEGFTDVLVRFPVIVDDKIAALEQAAAARVELADWYSTPVHPLQQDDWHLVNYSAGSCPNAEWMADHLVSLPMSPTTTLKHIRGAADLLRVI